MATYFTFLPSFLFILIGGPFVESMQDSQRLVAPLTAITAAVVGVILNLAMFFAYHVFWPNGLSMPVDRLSIVVTALSVLLLFRTKLGVVPLILLTGVLGLLYRTLM